MAKNWFWALLLHKICGDVSYLEGGLLARAWRARYKLLTSLSLTLTWRDLIEIRYNMIRYKMFAMTWYKMILLWYGYDIVMIWFWYDIIYWFVMIWYGLVIIWYDILFGDDMIWFGDYMMWYMVWWWYDMIYCLVMIWYGLVMIWWYMVWWWYDMI